MSEATGHRWTRRRVLTLALAPAAVLAGAGLAGTELVSRGILPGRSVLAKLDGACSVPVLPLAYSPPGRRSRARSSPRPGAGRSGTRSPTRPATAPATSCRWW